MQGAKIIIPKISLRLADSFQLGGFQGFQLSAGSEQTKQQPFLATVTYAGVASDGAVGGTETVEGGPYKIFIPNSVMEARAGDLIDKGVFVAESLDTHDGSKRIGTWLDAYMDRIIGTEIYAVRGGGIIDTRDVAREFGASMMGKILERARFGELGFSYDLKDAPGHLDDTIMPGGERVLVLDDFKWRGATILRREAAAYSWTNLAAQRISAAQSAHAARATLPTSATASAAAGNSQQSTTEDTEVDEKKLKEMLDSLSAGLTTSLKSDIKTAVTEAVAPIDARLKALEVKAGAPVAAAATAAGGDGKATIKDLIAGIKTAMVDANKPILDAIKAQTATPGQGTRTTYTAAQIETVKKYGGAAVDEDDPMSVDAHNAAIAVVQASATMTKDQKGRVIQELRSSRRTAEATAAQKGVN